MVCGAAKGNDRSLVAACKPCKRVLGYSRQGPGVGDEDLGFRVEAAGSRVQGLRFRV